MLFFFLFFIFGFCYDFCLKYDALFFLLLKLVNKDYFDGTVFIYFLFGIL